MERGLVERGLVEVETLEKDVSGANTSLLLLESAVWSTVSLSGAGCPLLGEVGMGIGQHKQELIQAIA